jgi:ribonuclease PH
MGARTDGRSPGRLRPIEIVRDYTRYADGSVLIAAGHTRMLCTAMAVDEVPPFLEETGDGWVTAEYNMLPSSTPVRRVRDSRRGRPDGRSTEIQRLIGRSLRAVVDRTRLGERTIYIDCDVLQADGGTRTLAITGAFVALRDCIDRLRQQGAIRRQPVLDHVAAVSVGTIDGRPVLDLNYNEDVTAGVDMNVVMTGRGRLIEVQGTAEHEPFSRDQLDKLLDLAGRGIRKLVSLQRKALKR